MDFQVKYSADNESTVTPRTVNTLTIDRMLVVKDNFKVSDKALHELHMLFPDVTGTCRSHLISHRQLANECIPILELSKVRKLQWSKLWISFIVKQIQTTNRIWNQVIMSLKFCHSHSYP